MITIEGLDKLLEMEPEQRPEGWKDDVFDYLKNKESFVKDLRGNTFQELSIALSKARQLGIQYETSFEKKAYRYLYMKDILDLMVNEAGKLIVEESDTIRSLIIIIAGKYVANAEATSTNILINGSSGAGKDWTVVRTLDLFPESSFEKYTRISPRVLNYLHSKDETFTWDNKVLYLEDVSNEVLNSEVLKLLASGGNKAAIVDNGRERELHVKGKPVLILTSTFADPNNEQLRRFPILKLKESPEKTRRINRERAKWEMNGKPDIDPLIPIGLVMLPRVDVIVPFSDRIAEIFPYQNVISASAFSRFNDYIKASAALHQYQRKKDDKGRTIADGIDYEIARDVFRKITEDNGLIPVTNTERMVLNVLNDNPQGIESIETNVQRISQRQIRRILNNLSEKGFAKKNHDQYTGGRPKILYSLGPKGEAIELPSFEELMSEMSKSNESQCFKE